MCGCRYWGHGYLVYRPYIYTPYSVRESSPVMDSRVASCQSGFRKCKILSRPKSSMLSYEPSALYLTPYTCYLSRDYSNSYRIEQNHYSNIFENIYNFDQSDLSSEWGLLIDDMEQLNFNFISITTLNMN